ncbi:MAG: hypothetical protein WBW48_10370, partial [Anaerolineae bacterium]
AALRACPERSEGVTTWAEQLQTKHLFRRAGAIAVPAFIVIIATLAVLDIRVVFEPPLLLPILNTVFLSAIPLAVAYIAARTYLVNDSLGFLLLGCGMLVWGSGGLIAGWLITPPGGQIDVQAETRQPFESTPYEIIKEMQVAGA